MITYHQTKGYQWGLLQRKWALERPPSSRDCLEGGRERVTSLEANEKPRYWRKVSKRVIKQVTLTILTILTKLPSGSLFSTLYYWPTWWYNLIVFIMTRTRRWPLQCGDAICQAWLPLHRQQVMCTSIWACIKEQPERVLPLKKACREILAQGFLS